MASLMLAFQNCAPNGLSSIELASQSSAKDKEHSGENDRERQILTDSLQRSIENPPNSLPPIDFGGNFNLVTFSCRFTVKAFDSQNNRLLIPSNSGVGGNSNLAVVDVDNVSSLEACADQANMATVVGQVCDTEYTVFFPQTRRALPSHGVIKISYTRFSIMNLEESGSFVVEDYPFDCIYH
jgi:hypothetical protein